MLLDFNLLKEKYTMNVNGILHIGGHYGQEFDVYSKHNITELIFFEPTPETFKILEKNLSGKAILINKALGNENRQIEMNIEYSNQGQSNSILKPLLHLEQYPHIKFNEKIIVDMVRLDDFMENNESQIDRSKFNMINMDVQGYELEVLKGAEKTLEHIDYIMTEINRDLVYENCTMVNDLDEYLSKYSFKRVETTWDGITWGDALYLKEKE